MNLEQIREKHLDFKLPEIIIQGGIDRQQYNWVLKAVAYLRAKGCIKAKVIIDSSGGNCGAGFDIYDVLRLSGIELTGMVYNEASSIATVILQACKLRLCAEHAEILIHHTSRDVDFDEVDCPRKFKKLKTEFNKTQTQLYKIYRARTGKSVAEIRKECKKDEHMSACEALRFGLIDKIV